MPKTSELSMAAVVRLAFEPEWLGLSREARGAWAERLGEILSRHDRVSFDWFDADALGSGYSDFVICRFASMADYHFVWEEIRDTELFSRPYVRIVDVTLGIERGYEVYEQHVAAGA